MSDEKVTTSNSFGLKFDFFRSKNFYVYLVCLAIASTFWLLNALTKTYTTNIDLPISYSNLPQDEILISELPEKTGIEVESFGFNLLSYKLTQLEDSIPIDITKAKKSRQSLNHTYAIATAPSLNNLMKKLPSEIRVKRILLDTLYFETQKLSEKMLNVVPQLELSYDKQHMQENDITISPERLRVTGAISALDTVMELKLKPLRLSGLNNDISVEIDFIPIEGVQLDAEKAIVFIPVDQMTEKELEIVIEQQNVPDSIKLLLFPKTVKARVQVPVSRYNELNEEDFKFIVDYNAKRQGSSGMYVEQERIARFCRVAEYQPKKVEFVIQK